MASQVFFITCVIFAGASPYGYTTNRELIGIIIASIVNIFPG